MGRAPCCDKASVKKGPWSPEEDHKLKSYIEKHGTGGNWIALPQKIGLKRCGKSCRLRWLNYLRPNIKHGGFSEEEDNIICSLYISIGSRWSIIAAQLPGRTDNDIKNYWNTRLKKKLLGKQRKDSQQTRRATPCVKQEMERVDGGILTSGGGGGGYWPELPVPTYVPQQLDGRVCNDDHASIRKLLIKLGGRFEDEASYRGGLALPNWTSSQQIYGDYASLMAASANSSVAFSEGCSPMASSHMVQVTTNTNFSMELDELLQSEPVKLEGQDCFYGPGNLNTIDDSLNWSEVSPSVYPPVEQSFQGMQQCLFEEAMHLGTQ